MPNARKRLRKLRINEVSLVDHPASQGARVLIWKRDGDPPPNDLPPPASAGTPPDPAPAGFFIAASQGVQSMPTTAEELQKALEDSAAQNELLAAEIEILKARSALTADETEFMKSLDKDDQDKFALLSKADRAEQIKRAKGESDDPVVKSLTAKMAELEKRNADLEAAQKAEIEKRNLAEAVEKARTMYGNLPGDDQAKGKAVLAISKLDKDAAEAVETMLKAGNSAMGSRFSTMGSHESREDLSKADAAAQLDQLAAEEAERRSISKSDAYSVVCKTDKGALLLKQARSPAN